MKIKINAKNIEQIINAKKVEIVDHDKYDLESDIIGNTLEDDIKNEVKQLISNNEIEKGLQLLIDHLNRNDIHNNSVFLLKRRFTETKNNKIKNVISYQEFQLSASSIADDLLKVIS